VAKTRLFSRANEAKIEAISSALPGIARENPPRPAKSLKTKDREFAERVGFGPNHLLQILQLTETTLP
jgi:hypothetical protein